MKGDCDQSLPTLEKDPMNKYTHKSSKIVTRKEITTDVLNTIDIVKHAHLQPVMFN